MKTKLLLFATLLMSGICLAQSDPTTFTNTNLPKPEPQSNTFNFLITTEDWKPVGACAANSGGCRIYFSSPYGIAITLPDIPNRYVNHQTITCTITKIVVTGKYGCQGLKCQSVTYTATGENDGDYGDAPCKDADGRAWTIRTTQYYHWRHSGRYYFKNYDGGSGTLSH
jgi:hypothetical protein